MVMIKVQLIFFYLGIGLMFLVGVLQFNKMIWDEEDEQKFVFDVVNFDEILKVSF